MTGADEIVLEAYLAPEDRSYIITACRYPADPRLSFEQFYQQLSNLGFIVYPGKLPAEPCFRIGNIGRLPS
jgi:2-aminoethylphosphonate-pyruvate transaminase